MARLYDYCVNSDATLPPRSHWPVNILAAMMFLVPAVGVPNEYMLQDTLKSAIAAFGILLAALAWTWDLQKNPRPLRWHWIVLLPLTLCLYALGSMVWSHTYLAGVEAVRWFLVAVLVLLSLNTLTPGNLPRLLWGVHAGALAATTIAFAQFMYGLAWFPEVAMPGSTFLNKNFYSEYLCSTLPISLLLLRQSDTQRQLILRSLSVAFMVTTLLMAGSRAALVVLVPIAGFLLLITWHLHHQLPHWSAKKKILATAVIVGSVVLIGNMPSSNPLLPSGTSALSHASLRGASLTKPAEYTQGSFSVRIQMWRATARMFFAHPLAGVGAGAWEVEVPLYQAADTETEIDYYAHNEFLQLISEYGGVVGGLVCAVLLAYLIQQSLVAFRLGAPLALTAIASLLSLLLVANAGFPLHLAAGTSIFGLMLALLAVALPQQSLKTLALKRRIVGMKVGLGMCMLGAVAITVLALRVESALMEATFTVASAKTLTGDERTHRIDKATSLAKLAIRIDPHYRKLTAVLGEHFAAVGAWKQAVQLWESVARSRPHIPALWSYIALGHAELGQHTEAQVALHKMQALMPHAKSTRNLELRLSSLAGHAAEVSTTLTQLLDDGDFDYERVQLAYVLGYRHQDWPLALKALTLRAKRWPESAPDAYMRIGKIYQQLGGSDNHEKARLAFAAGLASVPALERGRYRQQVIASEISSRQ